MYGQNPLVYSEQFAHCGPIRPILQRAATHCLHIEPAAMHFLRRLVTMNDDTTQHAELEHDLVQQFLFRPRQMIHPGAVDSVK